MRSSLPRDHWFQSSHSSSEDMVIRSTAVIASLRGSGLAGGGRRSSGSTGASARIRPSAWAMPANMPATVLVAERASRRASAPPSSK